MRHGRVDHRSRRLAPGNNGESSIEGFYFYYRSLVSLIRLSLQCGKLFTAKELMEQMRDRIVLTSPP